jgi:hypothetical protein
MGWIIGAYAASPTRDGWLENEEEEFLNGIYGLKNLSGLEVPFSESIHKFDEDWFIKRFPSHLQLVLTLIAGTTASVKANPLWGISSTNEDGRLAAVNFVKSCLSSIKKVNDAKGVGVVKTIQIHSAPGGEGSSINALSNSLSEIHTVNWEGAEIVIEHCDALVAGQAKQKGYLSLSQEIEAIKLSQTPTRLSINWGRSAIETRSADGPINHLLQAHSENLLSGLMFSGASDVENRFGKAWADCHVPPASLSDNPSELLETSSLMTVDEIRKCIVAAGDVKYTGLKIAPLKEITVADRVKTVAQSLEILETANSSIK